MNPYFTLSLSFYCNPPIQDYTIHVPMEQLTKLSTWSSAPKLHSHQRFASNARLQKRRPNRLNWRTLGIGRDGAPSAVKASDGGVVDTAVVERPKLRRFQVSEGHPSPFGATPRDGGVNFAVYAGNAVSATLCLITLTDLEEDKFTEQISLDPSTNKTGNVWHVFLTGDFKDILYGYKFDGKFSPEEGHYYDSSKIVLDPYAKAVIRRGEFGSLGPDGNCWPQMACTVPSFDDKFDWKGDLPLRYPQKDLIIYEMHVRGFTRHESSMTELPGTYLGLVEKLDHLKELGINCIELMPCHEFNELEYFGYNSVLGDYKVNYWGYSTVNYFSPMIRYSSAGTRNCGRDAINEVKFLIKEAHRRGIEVIMDVVFNHTAEGNENGPILSFRGADNSVYYMLAPKGEFYNYSGCGNTFNCNHPVVRQFIVDCLSLTLLLHYTGKVWKEMKYRKSSSYSVVDSIRVLTISWSYISSIGEPLFMVGIDSGFGWCSFGGRGGCGGRGFSNRPINIAPKFLSMKGELRRRWPWVREKGEEDAKEERQGKIPNLG